MTASVDVVPGRAYRAWWIWTEPARLLIRLLTERFVRGSGWMLAFSAIRLTAHLAVGHPWWTALLALAWLVGVPFVVVLMAGVVVEVGLKWLGWRAGRPHVLSVWRLAWKFHRQWPRVWADSAAKTREIQSFDGGARGESRAAAVRPVVDHPRMPWRFWVRWPVVTFRIGVAPGRTFTQFEKVMSAMAANLLWVHSIELEYETDRSSFGLLHVALADVLAVPDTPDWGNTDDEAAGQGRTRRFRVVRDNDDDRHNDDGEGEVA